MKIIESVIERKKRATQMVAGMPEDQAKQVFEMLDKLNAQEVLVLRRALGTAGRDDELRAVDEAAAKADPSWITP